MKKFTSLTQRVGESGEMIACIYLERHGYEIIERNYTKKWGEIDIIARRRDAIHFIEVKSVTRENTSMRPEDQMDAWKQRKIARTIEIYVNSLGIGRWQFDVVCVFMDMKLRKARVKLLEDIILC